MASKEVYVAKPLNLVEGENWVSIFGVHNSNSLASVFGNEASVLVGDFLYSRAFQMMVRIGQMRIMDVMADATNTIAEGEVLQLLNAHNPDIGEEQYLEVIRRKTAKLFEAGAQVAAILAGASEEVQKAMVSYGRHLGLAFQLVDDALDYDATTEELGKDRKSTRLNSSHSSVARMASSA